MFCDWHKTRDRECINDLKANKFGSSFCEMGTDIIISKVVEKLHKIVSNNLFTEEKCKLFFENVGLAIESLYVNESLPSDKTNLFYLSETTAALRNFVGSAGNDQMIGRLILNEFEKNFKLLQSLANITNHYGRALENIINCQKNKSLDEEYVQIILRLAQFFYNLLNIQTSFNDKNITRLVFAVSPIFDLQILLFVFSLYNFNQYTDKLNSLIQKVAYVFTSILHCVLKGTYFIQDFSSKLWGSSPEILLLWNHILNHIKLEFSEWSLWAINLRLKHDDGFFKTLYSASEIESRLILLDILFEMKIDDDVKCSSNNIFSTKCVEFLIDIYQDEIGMFINAASFGTIESYCTHNKFLVCKLSSLLLKVLTSGDHYRDIIKDKKILFENLVKLLKAVQLLGRNDPNSLFASKSRLADVNQDNEIDCSVYGFKRDIIGLIANMVYQNTEAQNYLRISDGLATLLDCAKIDSRNPFVLQWSILAIRNALEHNSENQQFVSQLNQHEILNDDLISQINSK